jgi:hypothetical protein
VRDDGEMMYGIISAIEEGRLDAEGLRQALAVVETLIAMIEEPHTWSWRYDSFLKHIFLVCMNVKKVKLLGPSV